MRDATRKKNEGGFTLIELLIVIGIIGFLAAAILVAVDPVKRIQDARDARRFAEVNAILNSMLNKQVDDRQLYNGQAGALVITQGGSNVQVIVRDHTTVVCNSQTTRPGCDKALDVTGADTKCVANLSALAPTYISELTVDPRGNGLNACGTGSGCATLGDYAISTATTSANTGYYIARTAGNRLEIGACKPEQAATVSVKR